MRGILISFLCISERILQSGLKSEQNTQRLVCFWNVQTRRAKALELLQQGWQPHMAEPAYDRDHALLLVRIHGFKEGLVFLYDKMGLAKEVLQVHLCDTSDTVIE